MRKHSSLDIFPRWCNGIWIQTYKQKKKKKNNKIYFAYVKASRVKRMVLVRIMHSCYFFSTHTAMKFLILLRSKGVITEIFLEYSWNLLIPRSSFYTVRQIKNCQVYENFDRPIQNDRLPCGYSKWIDRGSGCFKIKPNFWSNSNSHHLYWQRWTLIKQ